MIFFFACFAAPYVLCHQGHSICSLLKKKRKRKDVVPPHIMHKLLRWLICMNIEHVQVLDHYWFRGWVNIKSDYEDHKISGLELWQRKSECVSACVRVCVLASHVWLKHSSFEKGKKRPCSCSSGSVVMFSDHISWSGCIHSSQTITSISSFWLNYLLSRTKTFKKSFHHICR